MLLEKYFRVLSACNNPIKPQWVVIVVQQCHLLFVLFFTVMSTPNPSLNTESYNPSMPNIGHCIQCSFIDKKQLYLILQEAHKDLLHHKSDLTGRDKQTPVPIAPFQVSNTVSSLFTPAFTSTWKHNRPDQDALSLAHKQACTAVEAYHQQMASSPADLSTLNSSE